MKTNSFNESIRQKLEQIQPDQGPDAWERFEAHRRSPSLPIWKTVWGKAAMLFLVLGAVAGGVHLAHVRETNQLKQTVQHLTRQRDSLLSRQSAQPDASLLTQPSDPISGVAQVPVPSSTPSIQGQDAVMAPTDKLVDEPGEVRTTSESGSPTLSPAPTFSQRAVDNGNSTTQQVESTSSRKRVKVPTSTTQPEAASTERIAKRDMPRLNRAHETPDRLNSISARRRSTHDVRSSIPTSTESSVPFSEGLTPSKSPERTVVADLDPLAPRQAKFDSLPRTAKPAITYYEVPNPDQRERNGTSSPLPIQLTGRLGLVGRTGAGQRSVQATGEVRIGERIGIQFGLQSGFVAGPRYSTEQEFERTTRRNFRRQHAPKLSHRFDVLNISETYSAITLPLRLNYYQPLGSNWWGVLGAGTDLDLSARHRIQYDVYDFRTRPSELARKENITSVSTTRFNNLGVSAGVEKRFGRLGMQLMSSWVVPVTLPDYRRSVSTWSGQLGLFYQVGNRFRKSSRSSFPPS